MHQPNCTHHLAGDHAGGDDASLFAALESLILLVLGLVANLATMPHGQAKVWSVDAVIVRACAGVGRGPMSKVSHSDWHTHEAGA